MEFLKSMFSLLIFFISIGALVSILIFVFDVLKWHDREDRVKVVPSKSPEPEKKDNANVYQKDYTESEVSNVGDDAGQYNSSAFLGSGLQS